MEPKEKKAEDILAGNLSNSDYVSPRQREIASGIQTILEQAGKEKLTPEEKQQLLNRIESKTRLLRRPAYSVWIKAAAIFLLVTGFGLWQYTMRVSDKTQPAQVATAIKAGSDKAILTLSDGTQVKLDELKNGSIGHEKGVKITKINGLITYEVTNVEGRGPLAFNTIITPSGGQFCVNLPDGTRVWLNAASALTYPTQFKTDSRTVTLQGEGYFEVTKDSRRPFRVETARQTVEVLGTHFNIQAYPEEVQTRTTLLEGSVKISIAEAISAENPSYILKPGQQANLGSSIKIITTDTAEAVSWKNGMFNFNSSTLPEVMRQLQRWYNVDIDYKDAPPIHFNGTISRHSSIENVLKMLEFTGGITFQTSGRKIKVINNLK